MKALLQYLDNFTPEFLIIETALLVIILAVFIITWIFNRKKYHNFEHQIPAGVVKSYLDSIIQNSVSLKSSLFRGGGLDVDASIVPQVVSVDKLVGGESVKEITSSGASSEEVTKLKRDLELKNREVKDLKGQVQDEQAENGNLTARIAELEEQLKNAGSGQAPAAAAPAAPAGNDGALRKELADVTKERDELKNRLKEYEIIEDDLANLKRLQQENEQLKKALSGAAPQSAGAAEEEEVAAPPPPKAAAAPKVEESDVVPGPPKEAGAASNEAAKSPEDLLSEFEKMLG